MKQKGIIAALAVALVVSVGFGAWQWQARRTLTLQAAAVRQRALLEVAGALSDMEIRIEKLLVASGPQQTVSLLGEIARQAESAQASLAQLPLRHTAVSSTTKLVGQVGDYALTLSGRVAGGSMLSSDDLTQWEALLKTCDGLYEQLTNLGDVL